VSGLTLKFTPQEMQVLNAALVDLPYRVAAPLIASINAQIEQQARACERQPDDAQTDKLI
jgi:hypothetical protein